jgi:hypothetical protein
VGIGVGIEGVGTGVGAVLTCLIDPAACLPVVPTPPGPDDPDRPDKPDKPDEPPTEHACGAGRALPAGNHIAVYEQPVGDPETTDTLEAPFAMSVTFRDAPEEGCVCSCGEYLQQVRGMHTVNNGPDWATNPKWIDKPAGTAEGPMSRTRWQEDGPNRAYGYRFEDPLRQIPRGPRTWDHFEPDAASGCTYSGTDAPGFRWRYPSPGEYAFKLEFRGAPVDACFGRARIGDWSEWTAEGYVKIEPPAPPPPPPPKPAPVTPRQAALCEGDQIGCATLEFIRGHDMKSTTANPKADENFQAALALELTTLKILCPVPDGVDASKWVQETLRDRALYRLQRYLHSDVMAVQNPEPPCP